MNAKIEYLIEQEEKNKNRDIKLKEIEENIKENDSKLVNLLDREEYYIQSTKKVDEIDVKVNYMVQKIESELKNFKEDKKLTDLNDKVNYLINRQESQGIVRDYSAQLDQIITKLRNQDEKIDGLQNQLLLKDVELQELKDSLSLKNQELNSYKDMNQRILLIESSLDKLNENISKIVNYIEED